MKLGFKLLAAPVVTALVVVLSGQIGNYFQSVEANKGLSASRTSLENFKTMANAQQQMAEVNASVYRTVALIASMDEKAIQAARGDIEAQLKDVQRVIESLASNEAMAAGGQDDINQAIALVSTYATQADTAIRFAQFDPNTAVSAIQRAELTFKELVKRSSAITASIENTSDATIAAAKSKGQNVSLLMAAIAVLTGFIAVLGAWRMQKQMVRELSRAAAVANEVAERNLAINAHTNRTDEVGDVMRALSAMTEQLMQSLTTVRESSELIRVASTEIAAGNQELSHRTEQAAANLQHAAASTEQLLGIVSRSTESAQQAHQLVSLASANAERGGVIVGQVVTTMHEINVSSRKISEIIGVIDAIAFQTNILALNAAVESARAGEQGRGFAVVASEVRSLAGRSAGAAKEIKTLINASVAKVDSGSRLVTSAGHTMTEIVTSVREVSDIIGKISSGSLEQSMGINLVNTAVTELDHMTQQNSALVEQSAAAAESLREQAHRLAQVVSDFRLSTTTLELV